MFGGTATTFGLGAIFSLRYIGNAVMRSIARDFRRLRQDIKGNVEQLSRFEHGMSALRWAGVGVVAVALARKFAGMYADSEQAWKRIETLNIQNIKRLESEFSTLMLGDHFITDLRSAQSALYDLRSAGVGELDLITGIDVSSKLALATLGTVEQAAAAYATSYNLFFAKSGQNIKDWSNTWADAFADTVRAYQTKLPELSKQFNYVAGQAALAGQSIEETLNVIGALITGGLAGRAGRGWSTFLINVAKAEKSLGIKLTYGLAEAYPGRPLPALEMIDALIKRFGGTNLTAKDMLELKTAVGSFAARALATAMMMRDQIARTEEEMKLRGGADRMARKQLEGLNEQRKKTKVALMNLGDTLSRDTVPALTKFSRFTEKMVKFLDRFFGGKEPKEGEIRKPGIFGRVTKWGLGLTAATGIGLIVSNVLEHLFHFMFTGTRGMFLGKPMAVIALKHVGTFIKTVFGSIFGWIGRLFASIFKSKASEGFVTGGFASKLFSGLVMTDILAMIAGGFWHDYKKRQEAKRTLEFNRRLAAGEQPFSLPSDTEMFLIPSEPSGLSKYIDAGWWQRRLMEFFNPLKAVGLFREALPIDVINEIRESTPPITINIENNIESVGSEEEMDRFSQKQADAITKAIENAYNNRPSMDYIAKRTGMGSSAMQMHSGMGEPAR